MTNQMILRPYQKDCSNAVVAAWREAVSTLVVMPTGTGKTVLFADLIRRSFPRRAMVLAHREELIWQALDKIKRVTGLNCNNPDWCTVSGAVAASLAASSVSTRSSSSSFRTVADKGVAQPTGQSAWRASARLLFELLLD
jgi:superfamily II DNA or RNA helicase